MKGFIRNAKNRLSCAGMLMLSPTPLFRFILFTLLAFFSASHSAQTQSFDNMNDDLNIGQDIFSDFTEELGNSQILEDERFFRYGRFFSFAISIGLTNFDGNRGQAYENDPPNYGIGINYFKDFQTSFGLGFEFSKHHFLLDKQVHGYRNPDTGEGPGLLDVSMLRFYFSTRYYIDTHDLGTALTYANPYFTGRLEYWYLTNKFIDQKDIIPDDSGGGFGLGMGFGLEFPIQIKESYLGVEFLFHSINLHDKDTQNYAPVTEGGFGYEDLTGNIWSIMVSYVINW